MSEIVVDPAGAGPGDRPPGGQGPRVDLEPLLSDAAREIVVSAAEYSARRGAGDLSSDDLLWAATRHETARAALAGAGIDPDELAGRVEALTSTQSTTTSAPSAPDPADPADPTPAVGLGPSSTRALVDSRRISAARGALRIEAEHLLLGLAADPGSVAGRLLRTEAGPALGQSLDPDTPAPASTSDTPVLDEFGQDLCALAVEGRLDPVVGRDAEVDQILEVLARRTRTNPVLVGEPGVGKTAVVEGVAARIATGGVPAALLGRRVVQLDLVALTETDARARVTTLLAEIRDHGVDVVLYLLELQTVLTTKGDGAAAAGTLLRAALSRGELNVIGSATAADYRAHIERNTALAGRFVPVPVPEPTAAETVAILRGLRHRMEAHHGVRYGDDALEAAVRLSSRYLTDEYLPEKAIDLLDQAGARTQLRAHAPRARVRGLEDQLAQIVADVDRAARAGNAELADLLRRQHAEASGLLDAVLADPPPDTPQVLLEDVAEVVSRRTGVPVAQLTERERDRLERLEAVLAAQVLGQPSAVEAVARAVRRARTGLQNAARPTGSFLFVGPPGVGKTELARALAGALFGDRNRLVTIDLNGFTDQAAAGRLVGRAAAPGRPAEEGALTEAVRRRRYSVVLLEDVDRAHADVLTHVVAAMETGRILDGHGRTIDFRDTVLIMTTRLGSEDADPENRLGFGPGSTASDEEMFRRVTARCRRVLPAQFLDRLDDVVVLRRLTDDDLHGITTMLVAETVYRLAEMGIAVDVDDAAVGWLAHTGSDAEAGARGLRRLVRAELDDRLSALIVAGTLTAGRSARVGHDGTGLWVTPE